MIFVKRVEFIFKKLRFLPFASLKILPNGASIVLVSPVSKFISIGSSSPNVPDIAYLHLFDSGL